MVATVAMAQVKVKKGFPELFPKRPVLSQPAKAAGLNDVKLKGVECFAATQTDANNEPGVIRFYTGNTNDRTKIMCVSDYDRDPLHKRTMLGSALYKDPTTKEQCYLGYEVINYDLGWGAWPQRFFKVDLATGDTVTLSTEIAALKWQWFTVESASQNPVSGELWGMCRNDSMSIYNPDIKTQELVSRIGLIYADNGEFEEVAKLDKYYMAIAFDAQGQLWAARPVLSEYVAEDGETYLRVDGSILTRLDIEKNFAELDSIVLHTVEWDGTENDFPMWWNNSIQFDYATGKLYGLLCKYNEYGYCNQYLYSIDTKTGVIKNPETEESWGSSLQDICYGLAIPALTGDAPEAPARVDSLSGYAFDEGTKVRLTWKNPVLSWGGDSLEAISEVRIYRESLESDPIATVQNMEVGGDASWVDEAPADGINTYYVVACLNDKKGVPDYWKVYAGEDTPGEVQNIQIARNGSRIELSWSAPAEGEHQGAYDAASLTYNVVRLPDSLVVAESITDTFFVDRNIPALLNYAYEITPATKKGVGVTATSDYIMAGPAYEVPYETAFQSYAEADAWTTIDANGDGYAFYYSNWDPASTGLGMYTNSYGTSDDYALSPSVKLQAGKTYKIGLEIYFQYVDTEDSPTKHDFDITIGQGTTVASQDSALLKVRQFGNDQYYSRHKFEAQYVPEADGEYNFGLHLLSANVYDNISLVGASIKEVVDYDLAVKAFNGPTNPSKNAAADYKVTVKNEGRLDAANYKVKVVRLDSAANQVVLGETVVADALAPEADTVIVVSALPEVEGEVQYAAVVEMEGDALADNNVSAPLAITVSPEGTVPFTHVANDGTSPAQSTDMPIYFYKGYSTVQSIYYPTDFDVQLDANEEHSISRLALEYDANGAPVSNVPVKIYIGATDIEAYAAEEWGTKVDLGAWIPITDQQLVFDGTFSSKEGTGNLLTFDFAEPFVYDATKNLVVTIMEEGVWENQFPLIFNLYASDGYSDIYRSLRYGSNSQQFDFVTADLLPKNCFARQGLAVLHLAISSKTTGIQNVSTMGHSATYNNATGSIQFKGFDAQNVTVYNVAGQTVAQGSNKKLNLTSGAYVVKATDAEGKVMTSKLQVK